MSIKNAVVKWLLGDAQPGMRLVDTYAGTNAGVIVSEDSAMRLAAVNACVRVLSEDVASLPVHVYRRLPQGGKTRARDHALYPILHDSPNPEMTAFTFKQTLMVNVLLTGNAYAFIEFDRAGRVKALWPLPSNQVEPYRSSETGGIEYRVRDFRVTGTSEMLHVPGMCYDGLKGLSPIAYARETIGLGKAAEEFGSRYFGSGTHLGGVIETDKPLSEEAYTRLKSDFAAAYKGLQKAHGVPILEEARFKELGISQKDAQFLDTRKYQRSEIAAIFRVPPHMIGDLDRATFSNIEHQSIEYLQRSLVPWLVRIEQEMSRKLLSGDDRGQYVVEHDTGNFLRGDTVSRMSAYGTAIQNGIMSQNECRERENLNPKEGGDDLLTPLNMRRAGEERTRPFESRGWRRAAGEKEAADEETNALQKAFAVYLSMQVEGIRRILLDAFGEEARERDKAGKVQEKLNEFYDGLANKPLPSDLKAAIESVCQKARGALSKSFSQAEMDAIDEKWMHGFLDRYYGDASARLIKANHGEVSRLVRHIGENGINGLLKSLDSWRTERAGEMADMERRLATNELVVAANRKNGYASIWVSPRGECRVCQEMHGRTITNLKPPLHKGCKCTVIAKREGAFSERENYSGKTFGVDKNGKYAKIKTGDVIPNGGDQFVFDHWASKSELSITKGDGIDDIARLVEFYAGEKENWTKKKRKAVGYFDGDSLTAEVHWYDEPDTGHVDYKVKW